MRVVDLKEMKEIESVAADKYGFHESLIIENVGMRGADFIHHHYLLDEDYGELVFLIGQGHNGADGLAIARHLKNFGHHVRSFLLFPEAQFSEVMEQQIKMAKEYGVRLTEVRTLESLEAYFSETQSSYFIVDAILGTGFRLPLSNYLFDVITMANQFSSQMIAVDLPSGIVGDSGEVSSTAIEADLTLAIGLPKTGHYIADGSMHSGKLMTLDAGLPKDLLQGGDKALLNLESSQGLYRPRDKFSHKNDFGHCLVVGGSHGLTGALIMAATSALRSGTGLVTAATWTENYGELASRIIPEIMTSTIPLEESEIDATLRSFERVNSIVIGPGMGRSPKARSTALEILNHYSGPILIDADAIRVLSLKTDLDIFTQRKGPTILTPHIGEFAYFAGVTVEQVLKDPLGELRKMVDKTNSVIVLKGHCTYLGFPSGETFINYYPNDGMATGGSGDVLAGIIGGLLAQVSLDRKQSGHFSDRRMLYEAICLGVAVHTIAGKHAADNLGERPMSAGSITEHLKDAFETLESGQDYQQL